MDDATDGIAFSGWGNKPSTSTRLLTSPHSSVVEHHLGKMGVAGSIPAAGSK